ncbi:MAG: YqgE/AlgH family protein [Gammaproteobacteria bacterium]
MKNLDLTGHFLIAMPAMDDPEFQQTVTYMCAHSNEGAMGIVINRPMQIELGEILSQMELAPENSEIEQTQVFLGGPVQQDRGIIIHEPPTSWDSTINVTDNLGVATSKDILEAISKGDGPKKSLVALGYASWGTGQLEKELAENIWLSAPADESIIFDTPPEKRWKKATELLGFDLYQISRDIGHA